MIEEINTLRQEIDNIDAELLSLLKRRREISATIIEKKIQSGEPVYDPERENDILARLKEKYGNEFDSSFIESIYKQILEDSKANFLKKGERNNVVIDIFKKKPLFIAGPCAVETRKQLEEIAAGLSAMGIKFLRGGTYKPRTSPVSFQGLGTEGLYLLKEIADKYNMFTVSEVLDAGQLEINYDLIDIVQIGSRNMSSYELLKNIARTTSTDQKPIILKRGFGATISEFISAAEYLKSYGNDNIILCLRGIRTFEQIDEGMRFTPDLADILLLKERVNYPVLFDPSHSSGKATYVINLARAAMTLGADGVIIEVHNEPSKALVDGEQSITIKEFEKFINA